MFDSSIDSELSGLLDGIDGGGLSEDDDVAGVSLAALDHPDLGAVVSASNYAKAIVARGQAQAVYQAQVQRQSSFGLYPNYAITLATVHSGAGALTSDPVEIRPVGAGRGDSKKRVTLVQILSTLGTEESVVEGAFLRDIQVNDQPTFPTVGNSAAGDIPFELFMARTLQSPFIRPLNLSMVNFMTGDSARVIHVAPGAGTYQTTLMFVTDYTVPCGRLRVPGTASGPTKAAAARVLAQLQKNVSSANKGAMANLQRYAR